MFVSSNPQGIQTTSAVQKELPDILQVVAKIEPDPTRVVRVFAPVGGRLVSMAVRPGDRVRKGNEIAVLESSDVSGARADYEKARADFAVKEKALARAETLYEHKVLAEKDYQQAQADADVSRAGMRQAESRLRLLGLETNAPAGQDANLFHVRAPRSGVVLDIGAAPGEFNKSLDSPQPICTIADIDTVWAVGGLFEKNVVGLRVGAPAEVTVNAYPSERMNGRVAVIGDAVDPTTRTMKIRVVLPNPKLRLKPEMFASMRLVRSSVNAIVIPTSSVLREGNANFVFVQKSPEKFEKRAITVGRTTDGEIEVTSGLKAGETVVSGGALLLRSAAS